MGAQLADREGSCNVLWKSIYMGKVAKGMLAEKILW